MISAVSTSVAASMFQARTLAPSPEPSEIQAEEIASATPQTASQTEENITPAEAEIQAAVEGENQEQQASPTSILDPELTEEEEQVVRELSQRDREVRSHERAHKSIAGALAGAIQYEFTRGPDGKSYAIGGEVSIDTSAVPNDPEATIRKMDVVIRAALAPADPSPQDMAVARQAQQTRQRAQVEARKLAQEERESEQSENLNALQQLALEHQEENSPESPSRSSAANAEITQAIQALNRASSLADSKADSLFITTS